MEVPLLTIAVAAVPIIGVAVLAIVLLVRTDRRHAAGEVDATDAPRTKGFARVIAILAFTYGLLASFGAFVAAVVTVSMTAQGSQGGSAVTLPVPASPTSAIPDEVLPPFDLGGELISFGYFSEVSITGFGMSPGTALLYFAPLFLTPVLHAIVAFGISSLASRIERNEGFAPQLSKTATIVGISLIVIGSVSQAMESYGTSLARYEVLGGTELGGWIGPDAFDLTHLAAGVGVLLVAVLLRRGTELQRDTAGLV